MTQARRTALVSALATAALVGLALALLALHPHLHRASAPATTLTELGQLSTRDEVVHGSLIVLFGALCAAFARYAAGRGLAKPAVIMGLVSFTFGIFLVCIAALIDGFFLPAIVHRFADGTLAAQNLALTIFTVSSVAVNVVTASGLVAIAVGIMSWSIDLLRSADTSRVAGLIGLGASAVTMIMILASNGVMSPHLLFVTLFAQGAWYVSVAAAGRGSVARP